MKRPSPLSHLPNLAIAAALLGPVTASAGLEVTVESFRDGNVPHGYAYTQDGIQEGESIHISEEPYLDYLIPNNTGSTGITARKIGGPYIGDSTIAELGSAYGDGGANKSDFGPDWYRPVFEWFDGTPLPFGTDYYGVSWGGWSNSVAAVLETQILLADEAPLRVIHFFNDGWSYGSHASLDGHHLTITHFGQDGLQKDQFFVSLPSGGAEDLFGDARQFYTALIDISGHAAGDFLLIRNEGGNIGYMGTLVAEGEEPPPPPPAMDYTTGEWTRDSRFGWLFGYAVENWVLSPVMGSFYDAHPWLYSPNQQWLFDYQLGSMDDGLYLYSPVHGTIWASAAYGSWFYVFASDSWVRF